MINSLEINKLHDKPALKAVFVPVACVEEPKNLKTASFCEPVLKEERDVASNQFYGGYAASSSGGEKFEYAQAEFGSLVIENSDYSIGESKPVTHENDRK